MSNHIAKEKGMVIGVGFQKTGTSTLREALKVLGYNVKDTSSKALIPILRGNHSKVLSILKKYDAVEDTPWYIIYKQLDHLIPHSKFVLTIRDTESWYKSVKRHIGELRSAQHEWIYGRGKGLPKDDKQNTIDVYNKHNQEVIEYFKNRPDDLLIIDFTQGEKWEKLCLFLNKEIPTNPFPHYNKSLGNGKKRKMNKFKFYRKQVKNYFKIKYIDLFLHWDR